MGNLCLADFVSWFNCVKNEHADNVVSNKEAVDSVDGFVTETDFHENSDDDPNIDITESEFESNKYKLKGGMKLVKRKKPKIIHLSGITKIKTQKTIIFNLITYIARIPSI